MKNRNLKELMKARLADSQSTNQDLVVLNSEALDAMQGGYCNVNDCWGYGGSSCDRNTCWSYSPR